MPTLHDNRSTSPPSVSLVPITQKRPSTTSEILDLTGRVTFLNRFAAAHGGFADIYKGLWQCSESDSLKVAIKVLRSQSEDEDNKYKRNKRLRGELKVWRRLDHENILPLYGTTSDFGPYTSMVCPWIGNGNLTKYLDRNGDALELSERFRILCEVASGLLYLHSCSVIHGDLSGSNILVAENGKAYISDFGMSILPEFQGTSYFTSSIGGAVRWTAPELYRVYEDDTSPKFTVGCDIYSFGSVTLQTLTGKVPYYYIKSDLQVVFELNRGIYPRRPTEPWVTESHWAFINKCWSNQTNENPFSMTEVLSYTQRCQYDNTATSYRNSVLGTDLPDTSIDLKQAPDAMPTSTSTNTQLILLPSSASASLLPFPLASHSSQETTPITHCVQSSTKTRPEVILRTELSGHRRTEEMPVTLTRPGALDSSLDDDESPFYGGRVQALFLENVQYYGFGLYFITS